MLRIEMGEIKVTNEQGKRIEWPVKYDGKSKNIWKVYEVWRSEVLGNRFRKREPSCPIGQLVITRKKKFSLGADGFNDGYEYFWVGYKSEKWVKLTYEQFKEKNSNMIMTKIV